MGRGAEAIVTSVEEFAWLAGMIDGEGTITVSKPGKYERYELILLVSNSDSAILERCLTIAACGTVGWCKPYRPDWKKPGVWRTRNKAAQEIIRQVLPYLVGDEKRRRAVLALQFPCNPIGGRLHITEEMRARRQYVYEEMIWGAGEVSQLVLA